MLDPYEMLDPWKDAPSYRSTTKRHDLLLVIFAHGFLGNDKSFDTFPEKAQHILSALLPGTTVECIVYPTWETKGELTAAVACFVKWLIRLTAEKEKGKDLIGGSAKIVLCGHSMGGMLVSDSLLDIVRLYRKHPGQIWPKIVACISFDTPYLGLELGLQSSPSENGSIPEMIKLGGIMIGALGSAIISLRRAGSVLPPLNTVGGILLSGAAVAGALYLREDLDEGYRQITDHVKFLGNLSDEKAMKRRVAKLIDLEKYHGILFRTIYVLLPSSPPKRPSSRTFITLPKPNMRAAPYFVPAVNKIALNEIQAHRGMFAPATNDGWCQLGYLFTKIVQEALVST